MKSILNNRTAPSAMYIILGIVMIISPVRSMERLTALVGWVLLIYGGGLILQSFLTGSGSIVNRSILVGGVLPAVLGIIVICIPGLLVKAVPICFGITMIASGVTAAFLAERGRFYRWKTSMLINILIVCGGILILFCPRDMIKLIAIAMGLTMIFTGISGLLNSRKGAQAGGKAQE